MPELRPAALLREYVVRELRAALGLPAGAQAITALEAVDGVWRALAVPGERYRFCANVEHGVCNGW
jgi:hypothetical protein